MTSTSELIKSLLDDYGCNYDENVIHQLNEYALKVMKSIIQESKDLADLSKRSYITNDDIKLAYESLSNPTVNQSNIDTITMMKNKYNISEQTEYFGNLGSKLPVNDLIKCDKNNYQVIVKSLQEEEHLVKLKQKMEEAENQTFRATKPGRKKIDIEFDME